MLSTSLTPSGGSHRSAKIDRDPFYAAYILILVLGLRRSEVLGLPWSNVSLDAAELYVRQGLQRVG